MLLVLSLEPHFQAVSNNEISKKNINVHWRELFKAKTYIYVT